MKTLIYLIVSVMSCRSCSKSQPLLLELAGYNLFKFQLTDRDFHPGRCRSQFCNVTVTFIRILIGKNPLSDCFSYYKTCWLSLKVNITFQTQIKSQLKETENAIVWKNMVRILKKNFKNAKIFCRMTKNKYGLFPYPPPLLRSKWNKRQTAHTQNCNQLRGLDVCDYFKTLFTCVSPKKRTLDKNITYF